MRILVLGGTRYMGKHLVSALLANGHEVTIATRGSTANSFENRVKHLIIDRTCKKTLGIVFTGRKYDVVIDDIAYSSNEIKWLLDAVKCDRYIQVSTASVYFDLHGGITEEEFDASAKELVYCGRDDFHYGEVKRQAECAIVQDFGHIPSVRVRFPLIMGTDDYTGRLKFYVEHTLKGEPMNIDNITATMPLIRSDEAGRFVAFCAEGNFTGVFNAASGGVMSVGEVLDYVKAKTGKQPVIAADGEPAPFNGAGDYSLDTAKACALGFEFSEIKNWLDELIDYYIASAQ